MHTQPTQTTVALLGFFGIENVVNWKMPHSEINNNNNIVALILDAAHIWST